MNYEENIGKQVTKFKSGKPFKSGFQTNTVKAVINHHILNIPAYTFEEDDSYVECRRCKVVNNYANLIKEQLIILKFLEKNPDSIIITAEQRLGKSPIKNKKKVSHEVIDLVYHEDEDNVAFQGTSQECQDFITEQGDSTFMYEVKPIIQQK